MSTVKHASTSTRVPTLGAPTLSEQMAEDIHEAVKVLGLSELADIDKQTSLVHKWSVGDSKPFRNIFAVTLVERGARQRNRPVRFSEWKQPKTHKVATFKRNGKITNKNAYKMLWCTEKLTESTFRPVEPEKIQDSDHLCFLTTDYDSIDLADYADYDDLFSDLFY